MKGRIGAHEIDRLVATVAAGGRYAARAADTGDTVEVTVLDPAHTVDADILNHDLTSIGGRAAPGLVPVVGGGVTAGRPHIVSAPVEGRPLDEVLSGGGMGAAAIDLLRPVAAALDALHDRGVVHRALTPAAVVVDGGGRGWLRYTGAHRPAPSAGAYAAPEQRAGAAVSHRTDLYSFACLAYAAVTGAPPGPTPEIGGRGGAAHDEVFRRGLAAEPTDRPPSAAALMDDLVAAFGSRYRPAAGPGLRALMWVSVTVAALVVGTAVGAAVVASGVAG